MIKNLKYVIISLTVSIISYFLAPILIKSYAIKLLEEKGWSVEIKSVDIGLLKIYFNDVYISKDSKKIDSPTIVVTDILSRPNIFIYGGHINIEKFSYHNSDSHNMSDFNVVIHNMTLNLHGNDIDCSSKLDKIGNSIELTDVSGSYKNVQFRIDSLSYNGLLNIKQMKVSTQISQIVRVNNGSRDLPSSLHGGQKEINVEKIEVTTDRGVLIVHNFKLNKSEVKAYNVNVNISDFPMTTFSDVSYDRYTNKFYIKDVTNFIPKISMIENHFGDIRGNLKFDGTSLNFDVQMHYVHLMGVISSNSIRFEIPKTPCEHLFLSSPISMKDKMNGFSFEGSLGISLLVDLTKPDAKFKLDGMCKAVDVPVGFKKVDLKSKFSRTVFDESMNERIELSGPSTSNWVKLESISKYMILAVLTTEDPGFFNHRGFDLLAIENSIKENLIAKKFLRGASTISMQTAKNLWLNRSKTISRKFQEAMLTMHLENILNKNEIMETYLNIVEFSPGEYGILKASKKYFNIHPMNLTLSQSLFLASMLPQPKSKVWDSDGHVTNSRMNLIRSLIRRISSSKKISDDEANEASSEELVIGRSLSGSDFMQLDVNVEGWE